MSTLAVLNDAKATLEDATSYPVYIADLLNVDVDGRLQVPNDPSQFIIHLILDNPTYEWGHLKYSDVRLQVDAWSVTEGEALAMLGLAKTALVAKSYIPLALTRLGRDGASTGYTQDFERGTS